MRRKPRTGGRFVSLRVAEQEFGIPYARLYRLVRDGRVPTLSSDVAGTAVYVDRVKLEEFLTSHTETRS